MENTSETRTSIGFTYGLIGGLIVCVISLLQYLGGLDMYLSPIGYVCYFVIVTYSVLAALKIRKNNEGFLEFSEALKITFTVFALALLLQTLFTYVLFNFIDVSFKEAVAQQVIIKTEQMMKKFGATDSQIDSALEAEKTKDPFAFGRVMLGYAISCIVAFIFCLLISVIVKKSKPAFNNI